MSFHIHEPNGASRQTTETIALVAGVVVVGALILLVQPVFSPFVMFAALLTLLMPLRRHHIAKSLLALGIAIFAFWFIHETNALITPFILAAVIAYLVNPAADHVGRRYHVPRVVSALVIVGALIGVAVLMWMTFFPVLASEFSRLLTALSQIVVGTQSWMLSDEAAKLFSIFPREQVQNFVIQNISPQLEHIGTIVVNSALGLLTSLSTIATQLINIILLPFLTFYFIKDYHVLARIVLDLFPPANRKQVHDGVRRAGSLVASYVRGQILVAIIIGTLASIIFYLGDVPYALTLGVVVGVFDFIPYLGLIVSMIVVGLVVMISTSSVSATLGAIALVALLHIIEAYVLAPRIIGKAVGIHPLAMLFFIVVFSYFFGFIGLLIAVPATAVGFAFIREWQIARDEKIALSDQ